jgi:hypothetical protein
MAMKTLTAYFVRFRDWSLMRSKRIGEHIEFSGVMSFAAFATLATALSRDYPIGFAILMAAIGIGMALLAAHNSYVQKSTALVDKYEERFVERMESKRKSAALFLLGQQSSGDDLEDVLDYFESPIAEKVISGAVDAEQIYEVLYHWIRLYWQAGESFIAKYRKEEPAAWRRVKTLYDKVTPFEKRILEEELERPVTEDDLILTPKNLRKYLLQEAGKQADVEPDDEVDHATTS